MLGILQDILCAVLAAGAFVLWALTSALNLLIVAVGAFVGVCVGLLPDMPAAAAPPAGGVLSIVNYFLPIGGLVAGLAAFVALWAAFLLVRIPLRWAKVL